METDQESALKKRFAAEWLKTPDTPLKAALTVLADGDVQRALWCVERWIRDPEVKAEYKRIGDDDDAARDVLPTKTEFLVSLWNAAHNAERPVLTDDKVKLMRLYAEVRGYLPKGGVVPTGPTQRVAPVMTVPMAADTNSWEKMAVAQQQELRKHATR